jgi:hypothetical protein
MRNYSKLNIKQKDMLVRSCINQISLFIVNCLIHYTLLQDIWKHHKNNIFDNNMTDSNSSSYLIKNDDISYLGYVINWSQF